MTTTWADAIREWQLALTAARRAPGTIELRTDHVRRLAAWAGDRDPWSLTVNDLLAWTGSHDWSRNTARSVRASLRRFWTWGVGSGYTLTNTADLLPPVAASPPKPRPAPIGAVLFALRSGDRDVALMVRLACELGLRRAEVAGTHTRNLDRTLSGGWFLRVQGKGSRERIVAVSGDLAQEILALGPGYIFPGRNGGHLSAQWVGKLVARALGGQATMHQLRHRAATDIHDRTGKMLLVREILGHTSVATTELYVATNSDEVERALLDNARLWADRLAQ